VLYSQSPWRELLSVFVLFLVPPSGGPPVLAPSLGVCVLRSSQRLSFLVEVESDWTSS